MSPDKAKDNGMKKQIVVVGAAGGVGLALVQRMLAKGHQVTASVLNDAEAAVVRDKAAGVAEIIKLDLGNAPAPIWPGASRRSMPSRSAPRSRRLDLQKRNRLKFCAGRWKSMSLLAWRSFKGPSTVYVSPKAGSS
jgi:NAD(P)-dependent dehydrogenase (short-subunit alcohol dehydrogenase family)